MGRPSASILKFVVAVVGPSKSSLALRIRTSSTGFWLILRARNRTPPLCHTWHHRPERHQRHCLFSQEADPQPHISKDATETTMAWTTAGSRSGMGGYELHDQLSEQFLRPAGGYFANFSSSVGSICEETYFQQAVYFSYTWFLPRAL